MPPICFNGLLNQPIMAGQHNLHLLWVLLPELAAAFDVGEQESDGSGW
jgi:hypothetical protein